MRHYPIRVRLFLPEQAPSATIYIIKPLNQLARQGLIQFDSMLEADATVPIVKSSDLVLFCRNRDPVYNWILMECKANNIPTVYDLDDNFWQVPFDLPYARLYRSPERLAQVEEYLSNVDLVRVYSPYLQNVVAQLSENISLVTPCIDIGLAPEEQNATSQRGISGLGNGAAQKEDKIHITYVTGRGREDALISVFAEALHQVLDLYPGRVEMHWWGDIPPAFRGHPASQMHEIIHDYDTFLYQLSRQGIDIGLAPLTATPFNLSKTNTKFRDYSASRIAGIYSNVEVYTRDVQHEHTGFLVENDSNSWFQAFVRLIEDEKLRQSIQANAYQFVKENYNQGKTEKQWQTLITSLLGEKCKQPEQSPRRSASSSMIKTESAAVQINLGNRYVSFAHTSAGLVNIKRDPGADITIVADITQPFPLASDSADLILAERCLDEIQNPEDVLREIYRVGKSGGQVCLLADYSWPGVGKEKRLDQNLQSYLFNEDTPQRWTSAQPAVYSNSNLFSSLEEPNELEIKANQINLKPPEFDLRCLRMELFYLPSYLNHRQDQKRHLRREKTAVCDQILYHMVVVKEPISKKDIKKLAGQMELYEPAWVRGRRLQDLIETLKIENEQLRYESKTWRSTISQTESQLAAAQEQVKVEKTKAEIELQQAKSKLKSLNAELEQKTAENIQTKQQLSSLEQQAASSAQQLSSLEQQAASSAQQFSNLAQQYGRHMRYARMTAEQVDAFRNRKVVRITERFLGRSDDSKDLPPSLERLFDDSQIFNRPLKGFRLLSSINLRQVAYIPYRVIFDRENNQPGVLSTIAIAPVIDLLPGAGVVGVEVVSPDGKIIARATAPATTIDFGQPIRLTFSPGIELINQMGDQRAYELRAFGRELDVPLRIYEWRKYPFWGLGRAQSKPFMAFDFVSNN